MLCPVVASSFGPLKFRNGRCVIAAAAQHSPSLHPNGAAEAEAAAVAAVADEDDADGDAAVLVDRFT